MLCVVWLLFAVRRTGMTQEQSPTPHGDKARLRGQCEMGEESGVFLHAYPFL